MAFTQQTFLGSSISSYSVSLGTNGSPSTLNISLADDPVNGDNFLPAQDPTSTLYVGRPAYFTYDQFSFGGIIQSWQVDRSPEGYPTYNVILNDPVELLDGTQVILNNFQLEGDTDQALLKAEMPNLFNVFDFLETAPYGTFGGSQINDGGMYWATIRYGIERIQEIYGPMRYNGAEYYIDFAGLPSPPLYYRVGGDSASILELVSTVCNDSGLDFFVTLEYIGGRHTIKFGTVSRVQQPPLGQIDVYVDSKTNVADAIKTVSANSKGLEFRNEVTSYLLLGGNREDLFIVDGIANWDNIRPFFGFSVDAVPITSADMNDSSSIQLNCSSVADILEAVYYNTKILELRCALFNIETWLAYLNKFNKEVARKLGRNVDAWEDILEKIQAELSKQATSSKKIVDTSKDEIMFAGDIANAEANTIRTNRVYEWIKSVAEECLGKKFLVALPDARSKTVPETGETVYEYDIGDTGYLAPGVASATVGLSTDNEPIFQDDQGKFYAFARFDGVLNKDLSGLNPDDVVLEDGGDTLFVKMEVDPYLINPSRTTLGGTSVVVTFAQPINSVVEYAIGDPTALGLLLGLSEAQLANYRKMDKNNFYVKVPYAVPPASSRPSLVAIPLRSNMYSYGPWKTQAFTPGGKVRFEKDDGLVPWSLGGYGGLENMANAKIANAYTAMLAGETGTITEAGSPTIPLGGVLKAGGPIITGISVSVGVQGVTTQYSMRTYTPKFGVFSLQSAERFRRLAIRQSYQRRLNRQILQQNSARTLETHVRRLQFLQGNFGYAKRTGGTPHEGLVAYVDTRDTDRKETTVASDIVTHFVGKFRGNQDKGAITEEIHKMGSIGWEGIFRPYRADYDVDEDHMPTYVEPLSSGVGFPNSRDINPFKAGHDIDLVLKQDGDGDYENYVLQGDLEGATSGLRPIGWKNPGVVVGWGYDMNGLPVPHQDLDITAFKENYLTKPEDWKAGPLDLRWDELRGTWAGGNFIYKVRLDSAINNPGTTVNATLMTWDFTVDDYVAQNKKVKVRTFLRNAGLSANTRCLVYNDESGYATILAAEC